VGSRRSLVVLVRPWVVPLLRGTSCAPQSERRSGDRLLSKASPRSIEVYSCSLHQAAHRECVAYDAEAVVDLAGPQWLGRWLYWALTPMEQS